MYTWCSSISFSLVVDGDDVELSDKWQRLFRGHLALRKNGRKRSWGSARKSFHIPAELEREVSASRRNCPDLLEGHCLGVQGALLPSLRKQPANFMSVSTTGISESSTTAPQRRTTLLHSVQFYHTQNHYIHSIPEKPPASATSSHIWVRATIEFSNAEDVEFMRFLNFAHRGKVQELRRMEAEGDDHPASQHPTILELTKAADPKKKLTSLHLAAAQSHLATVKYLVEHGAELEAESRSGLTPLLAAIRGLSENLRDLRDKQRTKRADREWEARLAVVKYLLCAGANPNSCTLKDHWVNYLNKKVYGPRISALGLAVRKCVYGTELLSHRLEGLMEVLLSHVPPGEQYLFCSPPISPSAHKSKFPAKEAEKERRTFIMTSTPLPRGEDGSVLPTFQSTVWHYVLRRALSNSGEDPVCSEFLIGGGNNRYKIPSCSSRTLHVSDVAIRLPDGIGSDGGRVAQSGLGICQVLYALPQCGADVAQQAYVDLLNGDSVQFSRNYHWLKTIEFVPDFSPRAHISMPPTVFDKLNAKVAHRGDAYLRGAAAAAFPPPLAARLGIVDEHDAKQRALLTQQMLQRPSLFIDFIV